MSNVSVAICVATFKRPEGLGRLIESFRALNADGLHLHLIVADNDAEGSGRATFDELAPSLPFPASYVVEPNSGLSHVRNRLVAEANAVGAAYMASADDDQTADPGWVIELVHAAIRFDAAAVAPNLQYAFPPNTPPAIQNCFVNPNPPEPTGTPARTANAGGSLYRMKTLNEIDGPFDTRMNLSGGEDSLLSIHLTERGGILVRCNTAVITENMPESRLNFRSIAQRAWREGNIRAQEIRWVNPSFRKSIIHTFLFAGYAIKNALMIVPDMIRYRSMPLRRFRLIIFGVSGFKSMLFGARNITGYGD